MDNRIEHREDTIRGSGDIDLFVQTWRPSGIARAVVALVHGIGEHSGRYEFLVTRLVQAGFAVTGMDNRGHGRSGGRRGHIDSWSQYREDVHRYLQHVSKTFPGLPVFLYGHSLGALIVTDYVLFHPDGLRGLIVSGHPLRPTGSAKPILIFVARILSRVAPGIALSLGLDDSTLSRDPAVVNAYGADPLVHRKVTARWGTEALDAVERVKTRANEIEIPLLVLHGGADKINSAEGSRELFHLVSSSDKKLIVYPGGYHEPHNDLDREHVANDVVDWIQARSTA